MPSPEPLRPACANCGRTVPDGSVVADGRWLCSECITLLFPDSGTPWIAEGQAVDDTDFQPVYCFGCSLRVPPVATLCPSEYVEGSWLCPACCRDSLRDSGSLSRREQVLIQKLKETVRALTNFCGCCWKVGTDFSLRDDGEWLCLHCADNPMVRPKRWRGEVADIAGGKVGLLVELSAVAVTADE